MSADGCHGLSEAYIGAVGITALANALDATVTFGCDAGV